VKHWNRVTRPDPSGPRYESESSRRFVREGREEVLERVTHFRHRSRSEEDWLVLRDVVVDLSHLAEVERTHRRVAEGVELAERREDSGAIRLELAVLFDDAELERKPEDTREQPERLVGFDPPDALPTRRYKRATVGSASWLA
jgi:hypothetical protein